jgi:hypothetical protein
MKTIKTIPTGRTLAQTAKWLRGFATGSAFALYSIAAISAGYQVLGETTYPVNSPRPMLNSLKRTSDGGYLILGSALTRQIWIVKTDAEGNKQWEKIIEGRVSSQQKAVFALESHDGGYLVIGRGNAVEFANAAEAAKLTGQEEIAPGAHPFAMKLTRNGDVQWRRLLESNEHTSHIQPVCGITTSDGYIFAGTKPRTYPNQPTPTGQTAVSHPWIAKVDGNARLIWETVLEGDKGNNIYDALYLLKPTQCGGPLLSEDGKSVLLALSFRSRSTYMKDGQRVVVISQEQAMKFPTSITAVMKFDGTGAEKIRTLIASGLRATLFRAKEGYVIVDHPAPVPQRGIRRIWLDADSKLLRQTESSPSGFRFELETALPAADGSFYLLGTYVTPTNGRGCTAVAALRPNGEVTRLRVFDTLFDRWAPVALAPGSREHEIAVLLSRDENVKLMRLRYQD